MQALSQLSYSPTEAGTLRAGHNPVKALGSWYYAFEIIGLGEPGAIRNRYRTDERFHAARS